jgi:hypothetical protein
MSDATATGGPIQRGTGSARPRGHATGVGRTSSVSHAMRPSRLPRTRVRCDADSPSRDSRGVQVDPGRLRRMGRVRVDCAPTGYNQPVGHFDNATAGYSGEGM